MATQHVNQTRDAESVFPACAGVLVRWALASGLSELSEGQARIASRSIDPGFRSLEADLMEDAMSGLENLRDASKSIVGIAHAEPMKARSGNRIRIVKLYGGCSR